ncbi:concanavalin A-like lectin/glucanase [Parathielavia hyrcaniae]|uniref:Concanavalin A-like lectin/glucanase n=1 Tax=Parathielavia hyrcaniae TaxID=113614 RepID=A0AAN6T0F7_9PEZI|nr:concanavalin A-like lectin/glucanase [Parathielavia hyrcaniae]
MLTGAGYRTVVGSIDIPALRLPPDANASALHAVSAWVGIDGGAACPHALLQVGVDMYLSKGATQYWAWFGWWPNSPTYLSDFAMRAGDTVSLNVSAHSLTSATLSLLNTRTGQLDRASMAAVDEAALLCGSHAEWIVEDFWAGHGVPLADFGAITFSGTRFVTDTGVKGGLERARVTGVRERKGAVPVIACRARGVEVVGCEYRWPENSSDVVY